MSKNQFKKEYKPKTSSQKEVEKVAPFSLKNTFRFLQNEKFQRILGLLFLLLSLYLFASFTSYLFTWKSDQDKLFYPAAELLFNNELTVENWLGKIGALTGHFFIYKTFGIASFSFIAIFSMLGIHFLLNSTPSSALKIIRYSILILLTVPVLLAYVIPHYIILAGSFGFYTNIWLNSIIGKLGTGFLLLFILLVFLVVVFNINFNFLKKKDKEEEEKEDEDIKEPELIVNTLKEETITETPIKEEEKETIDEEIVEPEKKEIVFESNDGIGFSVESTENKEEILSDEEIQNAVKEFGEFDPTLDLSSYQFPSLDLLENHGNNQLSINKEELENNKEKILRTLENYSIKIDHIKATIGPTVTLYEIVPAPGVRISKIKNLENDIALSLAALGIRIIAPIPGKGTIGIEVPNQNPDIVSMRAVLASEKFQHAKMDLPIALGKTISNETFVTDLSKMPHLLMAGATGQGKSVGINAILASLLYKKHPSQLKLVLIDPKKVELTPYSKIVRHFLAKLPDAEEAIITDTKKALYTLNSLCIEMDTRYGLLKEAGVRNIKEYNERFIQRKLNPNNGHRFLPYIVVIVDEFADLIMTAGKEVETPIARLAQLARAIGIHLIIATQRPSTNIITGVIKANFPARLAFRVSSQIDSRTILDSGGAEQLIGRGDMLISTGNDLTRVQCAFIDTPEVEKLTEFIGSQRGYPDAFLLPEFVDESGNAAATDFSSEDIDALFVEAAKIIVQHQQGSASLLQRKLKLGYNRAGRLIDQLEAAGIIGPFEGSKARQVKITDEMSLEQYLKDNGYKS
ncbi:MAG: DNA translocase FtsK 4TM domain-containing protein [Flavobacteriales bacterium]|nr:DNA translocase FtsK 4TM domain-containing protein [Flavobacteriales bacterium]